MIRQNQELKFHKPVLLSEVLEAFKLPAHLNKKSPGITHEIKFIDATVGLGGHSSEIIKRGGKVLGLDADTEMLRIAENILRDACPTPYINGKECFTLVHSNFIKIDEIAVNHGYSQVEGILFDLGVSTPQLTSDLRGLSYRNRDVLLDMRLDPLSQGVTGADLLNVLHKAQLIDMYANVMNRSSAIKLANKVDNYRQQKVFRTVGDFLDVIEKSVQKKKTLNIATLPMMALRIAVNTEIQNITEALPKAFALLKTKGRLAVISFHSLEDEKVKVFYKACENKNLAKIITKKPVTPTAEEISVNKRARSAKLRVLEKI